MANQSMRQFFSSAVVVFCFVAANLFAAGPVILDGGDRDDHPPGGTVFITESVKFVYGAAVNGGTGILIIGASGQALTAAQTAIANAGLPAPTVVTGAAIATVNFNQFRMIYVPSDLTNTPGGITDADIAALTARKLDIQAFIVSGGGLFALTEAAALTPYAYVAIPQPFTISTTIPSDVLSLTPAATAIGFNISNADLNGGTPTHNRFTGPPGFNGLKALVVDATGAVVTIGGLANIGATVAISKVAAPSPVASGGTLTYTFTVTNTGAAPANNVVAVEQIPTGLTFTSASAGCALNGGTVTCNLGGLAAGASTTFTVAGTVTGAGGGNVVNSTYSASANGVPANPGTPATTPISAAVGPASLGLPTLSEWGMLALIMGVIAIAAMKLTKV